MAKITLRDIYWDKYGVGGMAPVPKWLPSPNGSRPQMAPNGSWIIEE